MHVAYLSYDVVKEVAEREFNFRLVEDDDMEYDIIWYDLWVGASLLVRMRSYQRTNHFPGTRARIYARRNVHACAQEQPRQEPDEDV